MCRPANAGPLTIAALRFLTDGHILTAGQKRVVPVIVGVRDRKSREFERRGQKILAAALSLFQSDDWEQVSVAQIAQRAEVGKGTIYTHFSGKDEIYARLAINFQRRILSRIEAIDSTIPVLERLREQLRVVWEIHLSSKDLHRVFLYCSRVEFRKRLPVDALAELERVEKAVVAPTRELVAQAIEQGIFPRKSLELHMFSAQSSFWGAVQLIWSGYLGDIDKSQYLDELTNFILAGLIHNGRRTDSQ